MQTHLEILIGKARHLLGFTVRSNPRLVKEEAIAKIVSLAKALLSCSAILVYCYERGFPVKAEAWEKGADPAILDTLLAEAVLITRPIHPYGGFHSTILAEMLKKFLEENEAGLFPEPASYSSSKEWPLYGEAEFPGLTIQAWTDLKNQVLEKIEKNKSKMAKGAVSRDEAISALRELNARLIAQKEIRDWETDMLPVDCAVMPETAIRFCHHAFRVVSRGNSKLDEAIYYAWVNFLISDSGFSGDSRQQIKDSGEDIINGGSILYINLPPIGTKWKTASGTLMVVTGYSWVVSGEAMTRAIVSKHSDTSINSIGCTLTLQQWEKETGIEYRVKKTNALLMREDIAKMRGEEISGSKIDNDLKGHCNRILALINGYLEKRQLNSFNSTISSDIDSYLAFATSSILKFVPPVYQTFIRNVGTVNRYKQAVSLLFRYMERPEYFKVKKEEAQSVNALLMDLQSFSSLIESAMARKETVEQNLNLFVLKTKADINLSPVSKEQIAQDPHKTDSDRKGWIRVSESNQERLKSCSKWYHNGLSERLKLTVSAVDEVIVSFMNTYSSHTPEETLIFFNNIWGAREYLKGIVSDEPVPENTKCSFSPETLAALRLDFLNKANKAMSFLSHNAPEDVKPYEDAVWSIEAVAACFRIPPEPKK